MKLLLHSRFGDDRRDGRRFAVFVQCYEGEESRRGRALLAGEQIFGLHGDIDFHRTAVRPRDECLKIDGLPQFDRRQKVQAVHRCGYHVHPGMPHGRDRRDRIDILHDFAAEDRSMIVRVGRKNDFRHDGPREPARFPFDFQAPLSNRG